VVLERGLMPPEKLDKVLSVEGMTRPGISGNEP